MGPSLYEADFNSLYYALDFAVGLRKVQAASKVQNAISRRKVCTLIGLEKRSIVGMYGLYDVMPSKDILQDLNYFISRSAADRYHLRAMTGVDYYKKKCLPFQVDYVDDQRFTRVARKNNSKETLLGAVP